MPQPVTRNEDGELHRARDQIEVYFNEDNLSPNSATNPAFYSLIFTNDTVHNTDNKIINPDSVTYDPQLNQGGPDLCHRPGFAADRHGDISFSDWHRRALPGDPRFESGLTILAPVSTPRTTAGHADFRVSPELCDRAG